MTVERFLEEQLQLPIIKATEREIDGTVLFASLLFRKSVDWRAFASIFFVAAPFIVAGVLVYVELSEAAVGIFLGSLLLVTVPLRRVLAGRSVQIPRAGLAVAAVPYGFLSGASFGVGMMLGPFMLGAGIAGETLMAAVAAAVAGIGCHQRLPAIGEDLDQVLVDEDAEFHILARRKLGNSERRLRFPDADGPGLGTDQHG